MLAALVTVPYVLGWLGLPLLPVVVAVVACGSGVLAGAALRGPGARPDDGAPVAAWAGRGGRHRRVAGGAVVAAAAAAGRRIRT